tara:strand:+ start:84 stop:761 length:678 start_codon:yes stop_codon:yes gene_type:complete
MYVNEDVVDLTTELAAVNAQLETATQDMFVAEMDGQIDRMAEIFSQLQFLNQRRLRLEEQLFMMAAPQPVAGGSLLKNRIIRGGQAPRVRRGRPARIAVGDPEADPVAYPVDAAMDSTVPRAMVGPVGYMIDRQPELARLQAELDEATYMYRHMRTYPRVYTAEQINEAKERDEAAARALSIAEARLGIPEIARIMVDADARLEPGLTLTEAVPARASSRRTEGV